jgi:hypothetical protein
MPSESGLDEGAGAMRLPTQCSAADRAQKFVFLEFSMQSDRCLKRAPFARW